MVRHNSISATKPIFPSYLLPTFKFPFARRRSSSSSSSSSSLSASPSVDQLSAVTTPSNSPPRKTGINRGSRRLLKVAPDTLRCLACSTDVAFTSQIISKGFTGRHGRAFLVAPAPVPAPTSASENGDGNSEQSLLNIRVGRSENRQLVTGWHVVADISCNVCSTKLGWKYVDAKEDTQKYKVGKFILETERVVVFSLWEDCDPSTAAARERDGDNEEGFKVGDSEDDAVVFDSEDEDECEDIFAGTWNAQTVGKRRGRLVAQKIKSVEA